MRVPVLSDSAEYGQASKILNIAERRETMAPNVNRAIWREPSARVVVQTISIGRGIDATIKTTVKLKASLTVRHFVDQQDVNESDSANSQRIDHQDQNDLD